MYIPLTTDIVKHMNITELVEKYHQTLTHYQRARAEMDEARECANVFGHGLPCMRYSQGYDRLPELDAFATAMTRRAWAYIAEQSGIRLLMSPKTLEKYDSQLEGGDLPELTVDNVLSTLNGYLHNSVHMVEDSIKELYQAFTPQRLWNAYKTNSAEKIKGKYIDSNAWSWYSFNRYAEQRLAHADRVFHLLDGKGIPRRPNDAATIARTAFQDGTTCETPYFSLKLYKQAGTLHYKFKRLDLVDQINAVAGGRSLQSVKGGDQ